MEAKNFTIYVVDDNEFTLHAMVRKLKHSLNCKVKGYTSAEECLHALNMLKPDLILSDYYLDRDFAHKMDGDRLLSYIKTQFPDIPVIMYSSKNDIDLAIKLMKMGATDFVVKEKTFLENISEVVTRQVRQVKDRYEGKVVIRTILSLIFLLIAAFLTINYVAPDWLPYFVIGLIIIVFFVNLNLVNSSIKQEEHQHHHSHS